MDSKDLEVYIGDHDQSVRGDGERRIPIEAPILHHTDYWRNDIAMLRTKEPMRFFLNHSDGYGAVNRICLPNEHRLLSDSLSESKLVVAGWGLLNANQTGPAKVLQQLPMKLSECPKDAPRGMICAKGELPHMSTRQGDSGSPLFWQSRDQAYLIGLDSLEFAGYALFVDVSLHLDWIRENW